MNFKPMLAATLTDVSAVRFPVLASPKLDGVRAIVKDSVVLSRSLKPIPNRHVQSLFGHAYLEGLDGELIVGAPWATDCYRITVSGVMREEGTPDVRFFVFDQVKANQDYSKRSMNISSLAHRSAMALPHQWVYSLDELAEYEAKCLEQGYEGVMLRDPNGAYKFGRSTLKEGGLLKLKRFSDSEAEILGFEERMHNTNEKLRDERGYAKRSTAQDGLVPCGTLGALLVRDIHTGVEFSVGTGFDDATRAGIWANRHRTLGALVKYKHFSIGNYDKPRFPTFLGFRDPIDL